eukprot:gene19809-6950_t
MPEKKRRKVVPMSQEKQENGTKANAVVGDEEHKGGEGSRASSSGGKNGTSTRFYKLKDIQEGSSAIFEFICPR